MIVRIVFEGDIMNKDLFRKGKNHIENAYFDKVNYSH